MRGQVRALKRRDMSPHPKLRHCLSRKHVAANPALCAPACVGQASRLFPSKETPSPFGGRPQAFETVASRRLFKVRDRRDACPTASFRIRASLRRLLRRGAHRFASRGGISPRLGGARGKWSGNYGTERMRQKLFVAGLGGLVKTSAAAHVSRRADAVETTWIIHPLRIAEIGRAAGQRVGLHWLPHGIGK